MAQQLGGTAVCVVKHLNIKIMFFTNPGFICLIRHKHRDLNVFILLEAFSSLMSYTSSAFTVDIIASIIVPRRDQKRGRTDSGGHHLNLYFLSLFCTSPQLLILYPQLPECWDPSRNPGETTLLD